MILTLIETIRVIKVTYILRDMAEKSHISCREILIENLRSGVKEGLTPQASAKRLLRKRCHSHTSMTDRERDDIFETSIVKRRRASTLSTEQFLTPFSI